ncbi:hypothetical protein FPOAC1_011124 [Fusarium poae]|uniref:hypothetical protein n=1 Tax=Fusarium poae TaxID=36050 RepID=UPI001CEA9C0F|nr:hypothetical protein FPOAC1_011124 [Fusarium poae]KAG8666320.1 hypothetical protein FPOAC1_011124 [Fusarium poae]
MQINNQHLCAPWKSRADREITGDKSKRSVIPSIRDPGGGQAINQPKGLSPSISARPVKFASFAVYGTGSLPIRVSKSDDSSIMGFDRYSWVRGIICMQLHPPTLLSSAMRRYDAILKIPPFALAWSVSIMLKLLSNSLPVTIDNIIMRL